MVTADLGSMGVAKEMEGDLSSLQIPGKRLSASYAWYSISDTSRKVVVQESSLPTTSSSFAIVSVLEVVMQSMWL